MQISEYVIKELARLVKDYNKGADWVLLMNKYGSNEVYDDEGLPDIGKKNGQRPSKSEYLTCWFRKLNNTPQLKTLIEDVLGQNIADIQQVNILLQRDGLSVEEIEGQYVIVGKIVENNEVVNDAYFKDIEEQILCALDKAEVSIWVAMAWFTNERIYAKLKEKLADDVDVRMVIYFDAINKKHGVNVHDFNTTLVKRSGRGGIMHDKFCVIDSRIVITGSYNWSDNAEFKNDENIEITSNTELASKYSREFKRLKRECKILTEDQLLNVH